MLLGTKSVGDEIALLAQDEAEATRLRRAARHMGRRHAAAVANVASALLRQRTLTEADLDELVPLRPRVPRQDEVAYVADFRQ
jgi:uncharacterized protein YpuA (DUF1002 family)